MLDATPAGRRVPGTVPVFLVGVALGAVASAWAVHRGINMDYGDSMAHLTIARRIVDSKTPGLQQLGTVWLPLPHLLLLPLVMNLWLWHTGIAACILGSLCLGATSAGLYRIMARLDFDGIGRLVGLSILLTNLSLLYACTEALTEPVLIACIVCCLAGLAGWTFAPRRLSGGELSVFAGIPAAGAVLSRYEGWALVLSGALYVGIVSWRRRDTWRQILVCCFAFAVVPAASVGWWLAYNMAWYGNPLEFLTGPYSAAAFTQTFIQQGLLSTKGNLGLSTEVYVEALVQTSGLVPMLLGVLGALVMTVRWGLSNRALLIWLAGTSSVFLLFSLTTGQHIMVNPASAPPGADYNNRYALSAVPWFALLTAFLVGSSRGFRRTRIAGSVVIIALMVGQVAYWLGDPRDRLSVINEGESGHVAFVGVKAAATWLRTHYDGGDILMDESSDKLAIAPVLGIPMNQIYNRSSGAGFEEAIADPATHVRWVFMHTALPKNLSTQSAYDHVAIVLLKDPGFTMRFKLVYSQDGFGIYRRTGSDHG
ncbi:hypothetical protein [Nocardioides baekrokdamisoli]|nr:hypothetical protein [Nocardioides baekrokdamisoli]